MSTEQNDGSRWEGQELDRLREAGDVLDSLEAYDQLELLLSRLHRKATLSDEEWMRCRRQVDEVERFLEGRLGHG
jgi:ribosome assembly protein YihI (activator of Der GTPase)